MKKVLISAALLLWTAVQVSAQSDARANAILAEVSKKYKAYDVIKTDFTFTIDNPQAKIKESQAGTLYARSKTNQYKVILKDQELISDGKSQWTYLKSDKEVQVNEVSNSNDAFNPARLFTMYEKGFKSLYNGETRINGRSYYTIDLTPLDPKTSFFKVRLRIDKATRMINNAILFDKGGNRYTYAIRGFTPNVKVPAATFTFDPKKHPGVEVVDLR
ncbi:MAG TPA: outer membrane lipoprotein carrier protein LolA [Sphingobacteriaceae bacterium]